MPSPPDPARYARAAGARPGTVLGGGPVRSRAEAVRLLRLHDPALVPWELHRQPWDEGVLQLDAPGLGMRRMPAGGAARSGSGHRAAGGESRVTARPRRMPAHRAIALLILIGAPAFGAILTCVLPSQKAGPDGCAEGSQPLSDLESVFVYGQPIRASAPVLLSSGLVIGREGVPYSLALSPDTIETVWVVTSRVGGRRSCPSNAVTIGPRVSVEHAPPTPPPGVYDLAGRHVTSPTRPGIYFARYGHGRPSRIIVIR